MKLICETCTINRAVSGGKRLFLKTILAIGKNSERKADETVIMLITNSNKSGTKYGLKNVGKIFTRFLAEGKVTISFRIPEHDVQIKSDTVQLTGFLKVLKLSLSGSGTTESADQHPAMPRLPCLTVANKKTSMLLGTAALATKCVVRNRKDYPTKGFPRGLVSLQISDIKLVRFDSQILLLKHLRSLNLSNNCLNGVPKQLGQMRLCELDLSGNALNEARWDWLLEAPIQGTLQVLNISSNNLSYLPAPLIYAHMLHTLNAENNHIRRLPFAIWKLSRVRQLSFAHNQLSSIPETMLRMRLDRLDLSQNQFTTERPQTNRLTDMDEVVHHQPSSLVELAARVIVTKQIFYTIGTIPFTLIEMLYRTPSCACGQICFEPKIHDQAKEVVLMNCSQLIIDTNRKLLADCVFCTRKCARKS